MDQSAVKDQEVEPAVVVVVIDSAAPAGVLRIGLGDTGTRTDVLETVTSSVAHQAVVFGVGDPEIEAAIAVDVGEHWSHRGCVFTVLSVSDPLFCGNFVKGAVALVVE